MKYLYHKVYYIFIACWLIILPASKLNAQYFEIGGSFGGTSYQGDINYLSSRLSFQGASALKGLNIGFTFENFVTIHLRYFSGGIEAYDIDSKEAHRRLRNLSFKTPLREISLTSDIEFLKFLMPRRDFHLSPYVTAGISVFRFNPQAKYKGIWYDLQPLSTEGQGLTPGAKDPYKLTQFAIPLGFGLRYYVNKNFYVSVEVAPRLTFTDYLDDISDRYPDLELLRKEKGSIAAALSYRGEVPDTPEGIGAYSGTLRGNPGENDWYIFNSISVSYRFELDKLFPNKRFSKSIICPRN